MSNINNNKKYHFIYKTTNLVNNKYYIGMHSTSNLKDNYLGSGKRLKYSIKKYGKENFNLVILEYIDSRELLVEREREIVNLETINDVDCLNLQIGGISGYDYINNLRKDDLEYDTKWRKLQGDKFRAAHKEGKINYNTFTGKKHSDKSKKIMSEKKRGNCLGENNSQFGTCWITKEGENKKIKKTLLLEFINNGWDKGRCMI